MLTFLGINTCSQQSQPKKFAVIKYQQETCTFCPGGDAGIEDWTTNGPYLPGDELIGKGRTNLGGYVGGFVNKANVLGNVEVVGINLQILYLADLLEVGILLKASNILWISF